MSIASFYGSVARTVARIAGRPTTFAVAVASILLWIASGPLFEFSDTWQLVINTATTIATFLMVFLIQSTQNRDTEAIHLKLDELIRATKGAHNRMLDIEAREERELLDLLKEYSRLAKQARDEKPEYTSDADGPEV